MERCHRRAPAAKDPLQAGCRSGFEQQGFVYTLTIPEPDHFFILSSVACQVWGPAPGRRAPKTESTLSTLDLKAAAAAVGAT